MTENEIKAENPQHGLSKKAKEFIVLAAAVATILASVITYFSFQKSKLDKEIVTATDTIERGIRCRDNLEYKSPNVSREELFHCYEMVDAGLKKLQKISHEPDGQKAIIALIDFYNVHNQEPNKGQYDEVIKNLEIMLTNSQKNYYAPK